MGHSSRDERYYGVFVENGIKGIRERDLAWEKSFSFPIRYCIYIIRENLFRFHLQNIYIWRRKNTRRRFTKSLSFN